MRTEAVRKYATVSCNDPRQPSIRLNIGGKLRHVVKVEPASVMLRGSTGTDLKAIVTLTKGTELGITVTAATAEGSPCRPAGEHSYPFAHATTTASTAISAGPVTPTWYCTAVVLPDAAGPANTYCALPAGGASVDAST